jgi:hypothetical protein
MTWMSRDHLPVRLWLVYTLSLQLFSNWQAFVYSVAKQYAVGGRDGFRELAALEVYVRRLQFYFYDSQFCVIFSAAICILKGAVNVRSAVDEVAILKTMS